jgi:hypothetical protein
MKRHDDKSKENVQQENIQQAAPEIIQREIPTLPSPDESITTSITVKVRTLFLFQRVPFSNLYFLFVHYLTISMERLTLDLYACVVIPHTVIILFSVAPSYFYLATISALAESSYFEPATILFSV